MNINKKAYLSMMLVGVVLAVLILLVIINILPAVTDGRDTAVGTLGCMESNGRCTNNSCDTQIENRYLVEGSCGNIATNCCQLKNGKPESRIILKVYGKDKTEKLNTNTDRNELENNGRLYLDSNSGTLETYFKISIDRRWFSYDSAKISFEGVGDKRCTLAEKSFDNFLHSSTVDNESMEIIKFPKDYDGDAYILLNEGDCKLNIELYKTENENYFIKKEIKFLVSSGSEY